MAFVIHTIEAAYLAAMGPMEKGGIPSSFCPYFNGREETANDIVYIGAAVLANNDLLVQVVRSVRVPGSTQEWLSLKMCHKSVEYYCRLEHSDVPLLEVQSLTQKF